MKALTLFMLPMLAFPVLAQTPNWRPAAAFLQRVMGSRCPRRPDDHGAWPAPHPEPPPLLTLYGTTSKEIQLVCRPRRQQRRADEPVDGHDDAAQRGQLFATATTSSISARR